MNQEDDTLSPTKEIEILEDTKLGEEWYIERKTIFIKNPKEFRIVHGAGLKYLVRAVSDIELVVEKDDLVFQITGENPLFLLIYDGKEYLDIP